MADDQTEPAGDPASPPDPSSRAVHARTVLITGASRGIGRAVALGFARAGYHVIACARTRGALEELDDEIRTVSGQSATLVPLNLRHADKVDAIGPTIYQRFGKLDVLVANAGVLGPISPLNHISDDSWAEVIDVNLTANWRLIRSLDPLLRKSEAGRAIFVSSAAVDKCRAFWGPYSVSKAGLEALVRTYANEVINTSVRANLLNPGSVATRMRAKAFPGEDPKSITQPDDLMPLFAKLADPSCTSNGERFDYGA